MGRWSPWRALGERDHIDFRLAPLPYELRAVYWPRGTRTAIVIDPALSQAERRTALAHELVHDERGGGCNCAEDAPAGVKAIAAKDERAVRREVARRLVPVDELGRYCRRAADIDGGVTAAMVADEFGTTVSVAEISLEQLAQRVTTDRPDAK